MTSDKILSLIKARHTNDVFVPECKGGPTWSSAHHRLDAWAMRRSWSRPLTWGYEIKVSRADFLGDNKWQAYLDYCNDFYFVCPAGVIRPEELPAEAGLLYVASTGRSLFTKKKAPSRQVTVPEELFRYVLMSRTQIKTEHYQEPDRSERIQKWKQWAAEKDEGRMIGYHVRRLTAERIEKVNNENNRLRAENEALQLFKTRLCELGVNPKDYVRDWQVRDVLKKLVNSIPQELSSSILQIRRNLDHLEQLAKQAEAA